MSDVPRSWREKTGIFTGAFVSNPVNGQILPIWVADYVLGTYGTGAIMAVPGHNTRDHEFAHAFGLPIIQVVDTRDGRDVTDAAYDGDGVIDNSGFLNGMPSPMPSALSLSGWRAMVSAPPRFEIPPTRLAVLSSALLGRTDSGPRIARPSPIDGRHASVAVLVLAGNPLGGDLILAPHAAHASRDIDPYAMARVSWRRARGNTRPDGSFKEREQLLRNEAGA
jgi:hypothetical protein